MCYYNTILLNIQDGNLSIDNITKNDNGYLISMSLSNLDNCFSCPSCKSNHYHIHQWKVRKIKHTNIGGNNCLISLKYPRLICTDCNKTFNPTFKFVDKCRCLSNDLIELSLKKIAKKVSLKDISEESNISPTSLINEIKKNLHEYRCPLTEIVCIDEFKASTIAGTFALIISDPVSGKILDILPTRTQDYIIYYLQTINKSEILKVKYVVTDLNEAYRTVIRGHYTNAIHIADRFHVTKLVSTAFNNIRIKIMNHHLKLSKNESGKDQLKHKKYYELLKKNGRLLISNHSKHDSWHYDQIVKVDKYGVVTTMNDLIEQCVNGDSELETAYSLLQSFYSIFKYSNEENAKQNILKWCEDVNNSEEIIYELKKSVLTIKSWLNEISNSFILNPITHQRMTNGFIEGKNNFVKVIKRVGFGYKDFDLFRIRILEADRKR